MKLPVVLRGAHAAIVNGTYVPKGDIVNGKMLYAKLGDDAVCLVFTNHRHWMVTDDEETKKGMGSSGYASSTEIGYASPVAVKNWKIPVHGIWTELREIVATFMVCFGAVPSPFKTYLDL